MKTEELKAEVLYYMLSGISIVLVQYPGGRIGYTRYFNTEEDFYFIWYSGVEDNFSLNKKIMHDISNLPLHDENEDQWFQLSCVLEINDDPYIVRAVQQYCKNACLEFDAIIDQNVYYPITIQVQRH